MTRHSPHIRLGLWLTLLAAGLLLAQWPAGAQTTSTAPAPEKIKLSVLYAGHAGKDREADFVAFLKEHFTAVKAIDLAAFTGKEEGFDVAVLDYDGTYSATESDTAGKVSLPKDYTRPTVTVGAAGAFITGKMGLKTGYL